MIHMIDNSSILEQLLGIIKQRLKYFYDIALRAYVLLMIKTSIPFVDEKDGHDLLCI